MEEKVLLSDVLPGVKVITFNRPQVHNALDIKAMGLFAAHIELLAIDDGLRVLIVTGAGERAFCSGGDLAELSQHPTEADAAAMTALMGDALLALENLPIPVIAAVNGYALGGGSEIAVACDFRIVDENVRLGFVQAKRGLIPGWGGGQRLMRLVGYARAIDILLSAQVMNAETVLALGLARQITAPGAALGGALQLAQQIASLDINVIRSVKKLLHAGLSQPYESALAAELALFPALWTGEAHQQSLAAFLEKQPRA